MKTTNKMENEIIRRRKADDNILSVLNWILCSHMVMLMGRNHPRNLMEITLNA